MSDPLRIGVLGASRIAPDAIVEPARAGGHRLVAVAARDQDRAERFAAAHGIERVHASYDDLLADPEVEVVYNGLVNSAHTPWNLAALAAGRHVLSEKPLSLTAAEAISVRDAARAADRLLVEGFHYAHHPVVSRLRELVQTGQLGHLERVDIELAIPAPPDDDPRWSSDLGGGALMDLGCYVLHAARQLGRWALGEPRLVSLDAGERPGRPGVDERMSAELAYPSGVAAAVRWDMAAPDRQMVWTVTGRDASATLPAFAVPHLDARVLVEREGQTRAESLGDGTSYAHQLAALAATLRDGVPWESDVDDSVHTMALMDDCRRAAGYWVSSARPQRHEDASGR